MAGGSFDGIDIDIDALVRQAADQQAKMERAQELVTALAGTAKDEDGLVTAEFTSEGLTDLTFHPKAMRLSSGELAELVKRVIGDSMADFQRLMSESMAELFGEEDNPLRFVSDPENALADVRRAEAAYNRTFEDTMGELQRIARRLEE